MTSLDEYIHQAMRDFSVPGFSLAVVKDDRVIFAGGYGVRSLSTGVPVDEHTTFAIASISKSFTATAVAMLADEGLVQFDRPVADYLPGFALLDPFASREITVRDLLIHDSGLPEVSGGTIWYGSDLSRAEVVRRLRYLRPAYSFRSHYDYQNVMYLAAGEIVAAVTGLSWDEFVRRRILAPLGMRDTAPNYAEGMQNPNRAAPYARLPYGGGSREAVEIPYRDHDNCGPAASMHASAIDLAHYLRLHLNGGRFEGQALFSPAADAQLHGAQIAVPIGAPPPPALARCQPRFLNYGMGWRLFDFAGRKVVQHSGGVDGMRTLVTMIPEAGLGVVALSNQEAPLTYAVTYRALDELLGLDPVDYRAGYLEGYFKAIEGDRAARELRDAMRVTGTRPALPPDAYCGRYASPLVDFIEVTGESGGLVLRFARTPAFTADLEHWHYNTFRTTWRDPYVPDGLVTFHLDAAARVQSLELAQPNLLDVDFRELGVLPKVV